MINIAIGYKPPAYYTQVVENRTRMYCFANQANVLRVSNPDTPRG